MMWCVVRESDGSYLRTDGTFAKLGKGWEGVWFFYFEEQANSMAASLPFRCVVNKVLP